MLQQIDAIVPPGTDMGRMDMAYAPLAIEDVRLRTRPLDERSAA